MTDFDHWPSDSGTQVASAPWEVRWAAPLFSRSLDNLASSIYPRLSTDVTLPRTLSSLPLPWLVTTPAPSHGAHFRHTMDGSMVEKQRCVTATHQELIINPYINNRNPKTQPLHRAAAVDQVSNPNPAFEMPRQASRSAPRPLTLVLAVHSTAMTGLS